MQIYYIYATNIINNIINIREHKYKIKTKIIHNIFKPLFFIPFTKNKEKQPTNINLTIFNQL